MYANNTILDHDTDILYFYHTAAATPTTFSCTARL